MRLETQRAKAAAPSGLSTSGHRMQCPAVNLMISPSKTRPRKVRDAALVTRLVWWRAGNACDSAGGHASNPGSPTLLAVSGGGEPFMSHHLSAVPHCYPLHKEAALFVHSGECQAHPRKFICISGCTQHALALTPLWAGCILRATS